MILMVIKYLRVVKFQRRCCLVVVSCALPPVPWCVPTVEPGCVGTNIINITAD